MAALQSKCLMYEENIKSLKSIISKQQQSLNRLDSHERDCNVIISGLSEVDIVTDEATYCTDFEKVTALFGEIGTNLPEGSGILRLGKQNPNYNRTIKLNVLDKTNRDNILQKAKELKNADEPWSLVYLKKDLHPVIVQENSR